MRRASFLIADAERARQNNSNGIAHPMVKKQSLRRLLEI
jgi:hypothetical protein